MNELRTIKTFYNQEQCKMYYPPSLVLIESDAYADLLLRKGAVQRVSIRPGTPMESPTPAPTSIPVSTWTEGVEPVIETKQITPKRNGKRH